MNADFLDLLTSLRDAEARFLVVGAYAVGVHGRPRAGTGFKMGEPPSRIDILTQIAGVRFEDAWPRRLETSFGPVQCAVIGRDDLLRNKRAAGRPQDLADVDALERLKTAKGGP